MKLEFSEQIFGLESNIMKIL